MTHASHSILPIWTPEREAQALRLYLQEGFSAAEVADALGCGVSRAAVIGKIRRLGFLKRDYAARSTRSVSASIRRPLLERCLPPPRPPLPIPPLREIPPTGHPRRLVCLSDNTCRWPIDDPGPGRMHATLFCAEPAPDGVYCIAHRTLAHAR